MDCKALACILLHILFAFIQTFADFCRNIAPLQTSPPAPRIPPASTQFRLFFGIFCVFFRMQKNACISEGFFSKIHRFSLPRGTPKSRKIDEFRCLQPALFASSVWPSFFYRFSVFFHNFHCSARCVFSAFCGGFAHAVAPFLCDLPKCDIAESTVKNNTKSGFSRFHSFRVFLREMCFPAVFPARGLQKNTFFLPQLLEFSGLEFPLIFDLFWLHFRLRNAEKRGPGGGRKKR